MSGFEARYPGVCDACEEPVSPGDQVMYDDQRELIHVRCPVTRPSQFEGTSDAEMGY